MTARGDEGDKILNISGGTNAIVLLGDYEKPSGGGGGVTATFSPPDYNSIVLSGIATETIYEYQFPVWLIGSIGCNTLSYGTVNGTLQFFDEDENEDGSVLLFDGGVPNSYSPYNLEIPVSVWIPPNRKFQITSAALGALTDLVCAVGVFRCL